MKNIFKKAHKLTRKMKEKYPEVDYQAQFGLYVSFLLEEKEEEKEMVELKGTEKQVKWANDIREKKMADIARWRERIEKRGALEEFQKQNIETIENIQDAATWIEIHKWHINVGEIFWKADRRKQTKLWEVVGVELV